MSGSSAVIRHTLEQIRGFIRQQALSRSTATKAKNLADPREQEFWDKLALQEQRLKLILRDLRNRAVALEHQRDHLWRIPRDLRYSARQSVDDREKVNLDLIELAELTLKELAAVWSGAGELKTGDWESLAEQAAKLVDKVDKALVHQVIHQIEKGPAFTPAAPLPGMGIEHLAPLIGLIVAMIQSKLRRRT